MSATDLDASAFSRQLRMRFGAFAIQQERGIGVATFLQVVQSFVRTVPDIGLVHNQDGLVRFRVVPDQINHADPRLILERLWFTFQRKDWQVDVGL